MAALARQDVASRGLSSVSKEIRNSANDTWSVFHNFFILAGLNNIFNHRDPYYKPE